MSESFYRPDQTAFSGSLSIGGGLQTLVHGSGQQGQDNIAYGDSAGLTLTTGYNNILIGSDTGKALTGVDTITAYGAGLGIASAAPGALDNTGVGANVFTNLYQGMDNAAFGIDALPQVTDGSENAAFGHASLQYLLGRATTRPEMSPQQRFRRHGRPLPQRRVDEQDRWRVPHLCWHPDDQPDERCDE